MAPTQRLPTKQQTMTKRKKEMRKERNTTRHPSALPVARNIHQQRRKIAGNWRKTKDVYIKIHMADDTMYTDQPGRFPATSSNGNQYIMVLVEVDGNYIDAEPMKNRSAGSMIKTYLALWARLTATGTI